MSKRHITKQQARRIEKNQADYHLGPLKPHYHEGIVITRFNKHAEIEDAKGQRFYCSIRANIDSLVAGDNVIWQALTPSQGVILSRYPRRSVLGRTDKRHQHKPIAANITQLLVVLAAKPIPNWSLLDSYVVMAENLKLQLTIILNKIDLPCESIRDEFLSYYTSLGYSVVLTSCTNQVGYPQLKERLQEQLSVFVGQSGVGKSSLIANILPHEIIQTAAISLQSELGCHTTSNSRLYHLPSGGALIDSPGVREFSLGQMSSSDILYGFREFRLLAQRCQFRNCKHYDSPGCALLDTIQDDPACQRRYENLIKMLAQLENSTAQS